MAQDAGQAGGEADEERNNPMEYVRKVDTTAIAAFDPKERYTQWLIDHGTGVDTCTLNYIRTPAGSGSPGGLHKHTVDQIFFILAGTMNIEIEGTQFLAGPGTAVIFPAGVPHRNWNGGTETTVHLAFNTPQPDPSQPFNILVKDEKAG